MLIDAFMYFNELDLLEIRLRELDSVVDKFVIVESMEMHGSANTKWTTLQDHWDIVQPFQNKVKYVLLEKLEPPFTGPESCWPRENFNRNALMPLILEVSKSPDDIVMVSDCDEIPRASAVRANLPRIKSLCSASQSLFYYNVNTYGGIWHGTVLGPLSEIQKAGGCQAVREQRDIYPTIRDCGWHFSYFGGMTRIRTKVANFAHATDLICRQFMERVNNVDEQVMRDIAEGRDIYHREGVSFVKQKADDGKLPEYLISNKERFQYFYGR